MSSVAIGEKYAQATADISRRAAYYAVPESDPEQHTVPAGEAWLLLGAVAIATTTADVGNRTLQLQVVDAAGDVFYQTAVNTNIAASQTDASQSFLLEGPATASGGVVALAKGIIVPEGMTVQVVDAAAIEATDTFELKLMVERQLFGE